jgi:hypothetical protein
LTDNRANIKRDDPSNIRLIGGVSRLIAESLPHVESRLHCAIYSVAKRLTATGSMFAFTAITSIASSAGVVPLPTQENRSEAVAGNGTLWIERCPPKAKVVCSNHAGRASKIKYLVWASQLIPFHG